MKTKTITFLAILSGLTAGGFAFAQSHGSNLGHHRLRHHGPETISLAAEVYRNVARFDREKDGKLDPNESASLRQALASGSVTLPRHEPSSSSAADLDGLVAHLVIMYSHVASLDANRDGTLDVNEQTELAKHLEHIASAEISPSVDH
jgi:hypothetical protein